MTYTSSNYQKYQTKNPIARFLIHRFLNRIFDTVSSLKVREILEVGCGEGFVIAHFRRRGPQSFLMGVDRDLAALRMARTLNPAIFFSCGDIYHLHFGNETFDAVLAFEILEHLEAPVQALEELCRVSRRYVLLSVPNEPLFSLGNLARGKHLRRLGRDPEHVQFWGRRHFIQMITPFFHEVRDFSLFPWTICIGIGPK